MTTPTNSDRLREIAERAEKATPGPWFIRHVDQFGGVEISNQPYLDGDLSEAAFDAAWHDWQQTDITICEMGGDLTVPPLELERPNVAFIAAAREDIPFLLSEITKLKAEKAETIEVLEAYRQGLDRYADDKNHFEQASRSVSFWYQRLKPLLDKLKGES